MTEAKPIAVHQFGINDLNTKSVQPLGEMDIHIWLINWKIAEDFIHSKRGILSVHEEQVMNRYHFNEDRMRYATGKILTRLILSQYTGVCAKRLNFEKTQYGKPYFVQMIHPLIQFNLSHSGDFVLLAFTKQRAIGVDVEQNQAAFDFYKISESIFTQNEYKEIKNAQSSELFFRFWTAKEAYVKARGAGLQIELDSFEINGQQIFENGCALRNWIILSVEVGEFYIASVVVNTKGRYGCHDIETV